jgi:hypothetical protein
MNKVKFSYATVALRQRHVLFKAFDYFTNTTNMNFSHLSSVYCAVIRVGIQLNCLCLELNFLIIVFFTIPTIMIASGWSSTPACGLKAGISGLASQLC